MAGVLLASLALLSGCVVRPAPTPQPVPQPVPPPPVRPVPPPPPSLPPVYLPPPPVVQTPAPVVAAPGPAVAPLPPGQRFVRQPPPQPVRSMAEVRAQAARRMVAAHPDSTYMSVPKQPLMGVPVLKVSLNADGSVNSIVVLREPQEAKQTIQQAIDAVYRAAPYGDLTRVPGPWEFVETFLFEFNGRFKPMTLDR